MNKKDKKEIDKIIKDLADVYVTALDGRNDVDLWNKVIDDYEKRFGEIEE